MKAHIVELSDSLLIDPQSVKLSPPLPFTLDEKMHLTIENIDQLDVEVCYRVLPVMSGKVYAHKTLSIYDSTASFKANPVVYSNFYKKEELFSTPNIYKTGSLTRGVTFGSAQNVNVVSNFNFQMDGQLTDNLNIRADITDQNVPFQPEGNTQQLRAFDNVTFEIYNDHLSLKAGDVLLKNREGYFMKYYKNVMGGQFDVKYDVNDKVKGRSTATISAAKGQFADITIKAEEGVQGPYRLSGPSGQPFVIVLANSESVFLDGRLLKRGFNHDYIIDYNLGEVTFNPNVIITQFARIRITFEYSEQSYSRSIVQAVQELEVGKTTFTMGYYREKDNLNKPLSFLLTDQDKLQMSLAGDDQLPVPIPGESFVDFNSKLVTYIKKDTLLSDGAKYTIFEFSHDSTATSLYNVTFSNVGSGKGDYNLLLSDVNGRAYEWIAPSQGQPNGSYAPVKFVPAPNMKQLMTLGVNVKLTEHVKAYTEMAFSNHDLNLYSDIGNNDNQDMAVKGGLVVKDQPINFLSKYKLSANTDFEYDGQYFKPIDRYRYIEYDRNWGYDPVTDTLQTADHIFNVGMSLNKNITNLIRGNMSLRDKEESIQGLQQDYEVKQSLGSWKMAGGWFLMKSKNIQTETQWNKWYGETYFDRFFVVPGYKMEEDRNQTAVINSDSLVSTVMNYNSHQFYLRSNDSLKTQYRFDYTLREDRNVQKGELKPYLYSKTLNANMSTAIKELHNIDVNFTYRVLQYNQEVTKSEDENLLLGRLNWRGIMLDRHLRTDLTYSTSSSRENLKEFVFIQVQAGQGTHTWRDLNNDGIQDLTEFFEAINFDERNYIKIYIPTAESIDAYQTVLTFSLNAEMPRKWKDRSGLIRFMGRLSNNTVININKKNTDNGLSARFNPFELNIGDENLVYTRDGIRSTFFYNRSGPGLGMDAGLMLNRSKQMVSRGGVDSRGNRDYNYNIRYNISSEWTLNMNYSNRIKENASQFQEDRNYVIYAQDYAPGIVWQPTNNFRIAVDYGFSKKINKRVELADENASAHKLQMESRWSNGVLNAIQAKFVYSKIKFEGEVNSASAYELLDALRPGKNFSWQINYNQKLVSGLQVTLGYEGRKSETVSVIHLGRMQVTMLF